MKLRTVALALALAFAPSLAAAEEPPDRPAKMKKAKKAKKAKKGALRRMKRFMRAIEKYDTDGDGQLSEAEVGDRFAKLRRFDANGDGWVTAGEVFRGRRKR